MHYENLLPFVSGVLIFLNTNPYLLVVP